MSLNGKRGRHLEGLHRPDVRATPWPCSSATRPRSASPAWKRTSPPTTTPHGTSLKPPASPRRATSRTVAEPNSSATHAMPPATGHPPSRNRRQIPQLTHVITRPPAGPRPSARPPRRHRRHQARQGTKTQQAPAGQDRPRQSLFRPPHAELRQHATSQRQPPSVTQARTRRTQLHAKAHGIGGCPPAAREVSLLGWRAGGGLRRRRTRRRPVRLCPR
jgi:hypothetical protein